MAVRFAREDLMPALGADANETETRVANVECVIERREGDPAGEPAERRDRVHAAGRLDAIDLSRLAAGPKVAVAVERQAFGVVKSGREDLEPLDRDFRLRGFVRRPTPPRPSVPSKSR